MVRNLYVVNLFEDIGFMEYNRATVGDPTFN